MPGRARTAKRIQPERELTFVTFVTFVTFATFATFVAHVKKLFATDVVTQSRSNVENKLQPQRGGPIPRFPGPGGPFLGSRLRGHATLLRVPTTPSGVR